jgi:hypothetical protein
MNDNASVELAIQRAEMSLSNKSPESTSKGTTDLMLRDASLWQLLRPLLTGSGKSPEKNQIPLASL